jgi:GNAT superfamily N-acetyltransferase
VSSELEIRPYQTGDKKHILELFRQSYGRDLDERFWAWRFRDGPAGTGVIYLSWDGDVLAAHYAVTPVIMRINGQDWLTGLSGTTMTHPDYRGRGLFPRLAQRTYAYMTEAGMGLVWGFPNALSHRGFVCNLEWVDIYEVPTFRLSLQGRLSLPTPSDDVVESEGFDARFDRLWKRVKDGYPIITRRDRPYLQWRYVENPAERYRILAHVEDESLLGYAVFKRYQDELQIVDILAVQDTDVGLGLISRVAQIALEESAMSISLWLNVTHPLHHALEKRGFRNGEPVTYLGGLALQSDLPLPELYDFRNWYLTMGDSDVF